jgi:hypothetical protein
MEVRGMCSNCKFWIKQNDDLIKINAALGERNRALEKVIEELDGGDIVRVLGRLSLNQLSSVKSFAQWLLAEDEDFKQREKPSTLGTTQQTE